MIPMTPSGTRIRPTSRPFGRRHIPVISPTGSGSAATCRTPAAIFSIRFSSSASRSNNADGCCADLASARSSAFAERIAARPSPNASAMAVTARFFTSGTTMARACAARRAAVPSSRTISAVTPSPLHYHQVVPMHHLIEWLRAKRVLDPVAPDAPDLFYLFGVIVGHAPREFYAVDVTEAHHVATLKPAVNREHAGWQQALAVADERLLGPGVHRDPSPACRRERQPALSTPHPGRRRLKDGTDCLAADNPLQDPLYQAVRNDGTNAGSRSGTRRLDLCGHPACAKSGPRLVGPEVEPRRPPRHLTNELRMRILPWISGVQPVQIGQHDQQIRSEQGRHQRRKPVVIPKPDLLHSHRVVFVDNRQNAEVQQRKERIARIEVPVP